jgi:hypothetical protein
MAYRKLRVRYAGEMLDNNVFVELDHEPGSYSSSTSVDVCAYSASTGEAHDCKAQAKNIDPQFVEELLREMAPYGFAIGVITAVSGSVATADLQRKGIDLGRVAVLHSDRWWGGLPLR